MKKWQYKFLTIHWAKNSGLTLKGDWRVKYDNGQELPSWKTVTVYDYCNKLGESGWEIVNLSHSPVFTENANVHTENYRIVLKKEVTD